MVEAFESFDAAVIALRDHLVELAATAAIDRER
jgi:hypothetical protein